MTPPPPKPPLSRHASRWILGLVLLAVAAGGLFIWVVGQGERTGDAAEDEGPGAKGPAKRSQGASRGTMAEGTSARAGWTAPADSRKLAEHLARLRQASEEKRAGEGREARDGRDGPASRGASGRAHDAQHGSTRREGEDPEDEVHWPVTRDGIRGAMRARIQEVKECYEGWLTEEPDLGGRLVVSFAIEASGDGSARIREARIQGLGLGHRALESCVLVMVESLQFEAPPKGRVEVSYPFFFAPRKE